jgi:hypothetical protein
VAIATSFLEALVANCSGQSLLVPVLTRPLVLLCNLDLWGKQCTRRLVGSSSPGKRHARVHIKNLTFTEKTSRACLARSPLHLHIHRGNVTLGSPRKLAAYPISTAGQQPPKHNTTFFHHTSFSGQKPSNHKVCHVLSVIIQVSLVRTSKLATYLL